MTQATCHPDRPLKGHGLCNTCYARLARNRWAPCHPDRFLARGSTTLCAPCYREQVRIPARREASRIRQLRRLYDLTPEGYAALLAGQGGRCAVCRAEPIDQALAVDHDHRTNEIRGLLCGPCNQAIGSLGDDPDRLRAAAAYLERRRLRAARSA